jgi:type III secretion protein J
MIANIQKYNIFRHLRLFLILATLLTVSTACESKRTVVNGLDEREANEIVVYLNSKGIQATKMRSTEGGTAGGAIALWDITVDYDEGTKAMSLLNNAGLPRRKSQSLLNLFGNVGLVPTDLQEKIRYQAGLAEQIASTIRKIDGVLDAEVQISFPEDDPLNPNAPKKDITASIYVKHSGVLDDPNTHLATKIKQLVTSSITGLKYDNVTLIPDRARYNEIPPGGFSQKSDEDKQWVNVWSVIIAKDSLTRFRVIFFTFCLIILLFSMTLVWIGWKMYPLLKANGGIRQLISLKPISFESPAEAVDEGNPEEKEGGGSSSDEADETRDFEGDIDVDVKK